MKQRILLAGSEIAGHYTGLAKGLDLLEMLPTLAATPNHFRYQGDYAHNSLVSLLHKIQKKRAKTARKNFIKKVFLVAMQRALSLAMPFWVISKFDMVFFCFGVTYTDYRWELWLYKKFNVKTIFTFHGSDARPSYLNGSIFPAGRPVDWLSMKHRTNSLKRRVERIEKYADAIFAYPAISHFFTKPFFDQVIFGNPVILPARPKSTGKKNLSKRKVIVLHCPSAPASKGSGEIRKIINNLKEDGLDVELKELTDVPNHMVHEALAEADLVLDSMWNDCPAGTFPAEGLHWHKPVVIGSYFAESYPEYHLERGLAAPYIYCSPEQVSKKIKELVRSGSRRAELSVAAASYANSHGRLEVMAEKYLRCISGEAPPEWICNPRNISYLCGSGAPTDHIRYLVAGYIERYGIGALNLSHRPELEKAFVEFSSIKGTH